MANLAIKGHTTRGKEVIEILEMLGGVNKYKISDANLDLLYTIRSHDKFIISVYPTNTFVVFTIEEFLEKFSYKVGDKVKVPYEDGRITGNELYEYKILKIKWDYLESTIKYGLPTGNEQCIEYYSTDNLNIWNKKETVEEIKIDIPKGYEFAGVDNDKHQVVFNKMQPQYPKTYEECSLINGCDDRIPLKIIGEFTKLINARNAYWKLAGEQMGLGKPWKPDWSTESERKYVIEVYRNKVRTNSQGYSNTILAFPTAEMRDAFYENFSELIEQCKELL